MTNAARAPAAGDLESAFLPLRAKWGWIVAIGVVDVVVGLIALGNMVTATLVTVFVVGVMMAVAGVAEVIYAFQVRSRGRFAFWLALGVLYVIAGLLVIQNPRLSAAILTFILGLVLVAGGCMRIYVALGMKGEAPWPWIVASGVITILLGILILSQWPVFSLFVLGIFLGVDLIFAGLGWIGLGLTLRRGTA